MQTRNTDSLRSAVLSYAREQTGSAAAEYAMILAIIGSALGIALINLGSSISTALVTFAACISSTSSCA